MKKLLNINVILDATYDLYKKYLGSLMGYTALMYIASVAIAYVFIAIFSVIVSIIAAFAISDINGNIFNGSNLTYLFYIFIAIVIIMIPVSAIIKMIASGPTHAVYADKRGEKVTFGNMFRYSFKKFWYSFTSSVAYYIIVFGVLTIGGLMYYLIYINFLYTLNLTSQIIVGTVIVIIMLVFYIWFGVKSLFYLQVAICERKHFFSAIIGSFKLTNGNFKRILWIAFSIGFSYIIIYLSLVGMFSIISNIISLYFTRISSTGFTAGFIILEFLLILIQLVASVAVRPIQYIAIPIAYANERNRLYGDNLHRNIIILLKKQKEDLSKIKG